MRLAETTSTDTVPSTPKAASRRVLDSATDQFATVLSATRRSSVRLFDVLTPRSSGAKDALPAQDRGGRADELESDKTDRTGKGSRRGRTAETKRADRLKSQARDEQAAEQAAGGVDRGEANASRAESAPPADPREPAAPVHAAATAGGQAARPDAAAFSPLQAPTAASGDAPTSAPAGATLAGLPTATTRPDAASPAVVAAADAGKAATATAPAGNASGSGQGATGQQAEASATAQAGSAATSKSSGSTEDFQSLLQQLARPRVGEPTGSAVAKLGAKQAAGSAERPLDMQSTDGVEELARVVRSQTGPRHSSMTLLMSPEELGRLRIDVRVQDDTVSLRFETETAAGQEAIKGRIDELKHALARHGIQIDRLEVDLAPPSTAGPGHRETGDQQSFGASQWGAGGRQDDAAGHARQPFDASRQHLADGEPFDGAAVTAAGAASAEWNWTTSGVDVIA